MKAKSIFALLLAPLFFVSCGYEKSSITGWNYNDPDNGGFQKYPFEEQETGPNLVLIEGGTFTMGRVEQDFMHDWNNIPRRAGHNMAHFNALHIGEYEDNAVRIVAHQIGVHTIFGDRIGLCF